MLYSILGKKTRSLVVKILNLCIKHSALNPDLDRSTQYPDLDRCTQNPDLDRCVQNPVLMSYHQNIPYLILVTKVSV